MTVIMGMVHGKAVSLWGDRRAANGSWMGDTAARPKVFKLGGVAFGLTCTFRLADLVRWSADFPPYEAGTALEPWLYQKLVPWLRNAFETAGYETVKDGQHKADPDGVFGLLAAVDGLGRPRLFQLHHDYGVYENAEGYQATGGGYQVAVSGLFIASRLVQLQEWPVDGAVKLVQDACEAHYMGVCGPWDRVTLGETP